MESSSVDHRRADQPREVGYAAARSPLAVALAEQTLNAIEDMTLRDGYRYEQKMTAAIIGTEDAKAAQRAFAESANPALSGDSRRLCAA